MPFKVKRETGFASDSRAHDRNDPATFRNQKFFNVD